MQNWQAEIDHWLPAQGSGVAESATEGVKEECKVECKTSPGGGGSSGRPFSLFVIRDTNKTIESRHAVIKQWTEQGGVLLIGYEMFRLLVTYRQSKTVKPKRKDKDVVGSQPKKKICIDIELEEKRDGIYQGDFGDDGLAY